MRFTQVQFASQSFFNGVHEFNPRLASTYGILQVIACPVDCKVTWALKTAEDKRRKTVDAEEPSGSQSSQHDDLAVTVQMRKESPMARIKLTDSKIAQDLAKFMSIAINGVQIRRWEFADADPTSILILWEGVISKQHVCDTLGLSCDDAICMIHESSHSESCKGCHTKEIILLEQVLTIL